MLLLRSGKQGCVGRPSDGGGPSLLYAMGFQNCYQDHNVGVTHEFKYGEINRAVLKFPNTFDLNFWPRASRVVVVAAVLLYVSEEVSCVGEDNLDPLRLCTS